MAFSLNDEAERFYFLESLSPVVYDYPNGREVYFEAYRKKSLVGGGKRGKVFKMSAAAVRRFRQALRRTGTKFTHFVTITFPPEVLEDGESWAEYTRSFWQKLAAQCRARGITYLWVREPHKSGQPHYHVICNKGPLLRLCANRVIRERTSRERGDLNLRVGVLCKAIYHEGGAARYMSKLAGYCSKESELVHEESYRHWGRNYKDELPEVREATAIICDWIRNQYERLYAWKFPRLLQVPQVLEAGALLPI